jgi:hypothetical protein
VISVTPSPGSPEDTVDQLFEALEITREKLSDKNAYFFALDIIGSHTSGEEFTPWTDEAIGAWAQVAANTRLQARLQEWLSKIERLIIEADNTAKRSTASLWEIDEVQFGEPAACAFALVNRSFVPFYTRLLGVWDLDHEVHQGEAVEAIVKQHGICPETEQLLVARATSGYGLEQIEDLTPYLEEVYGDLPNSAFFRSMVEAFYTKDRSWRQSMKGKNLPDGNILDHWPTAPALKAKAVEIWAELDAAAGPLA